jgi:hypothetical protein
LRGLRDAARKTIDPMEDVGFQFPTNRRFVIKSQTAHELRRCGFFLVFTTYADQLDYTVHEDNRPIGARWYHSE